jgi:hypothetical protein
MPSLAKTLAILIAHSGGSALLLVVVFSIAAGLGRFATMMAMTDTSPEIVSLFRFAAHVLFVLDVLAVLGLAVRGTVELLLRQM